MSEIKIQTLTAVHVGSGETLQYGTDFVPVEHGDNDVISVVDPKQVLDLIGTENVHKWIASIERKESTKDVVKRFAPTANIEDYSKRFILEWSQAKSTDTLKEHIHDGRGVPYIPGSSIKGAIRTAILSTMAKNTPGLEGMLKDQRQKVTAKQIESRFFGSNPNKDVFRFLQVGDAYFGNNYEVAIRMVNINERERHSFWDLSKPQLIEAIGPEDETTFQMKLNIDGYEFSKDSVKQCPECMKSMSALFETINNHTRHLLESEIEYWQERESNDDSERVGDYIDRIKAILDYAKACSVGKECVLRIGHGAGWRFITGAWAENLDNFASVVIPASRPKNFKYEHYDFPKTRRVDDECELLGFVKMTMV